MSELDFIPVAIRDVGVPSKVLLGDVSAGTAFTAKPTSNKVTIIKFAVMLFLNWIAFPALLSQPSCGSQPKTRRYILSARSQKLVVASQSNPHERIKGTFIQWWYLDISRVIEF